MEEENVPELPKMSEQKANSKETTIETDSISEADIENPRRPSSRRKNKIQPKQVVEVMFKNKRSSGKLLIIPPI